MIQEKQLMYYHRITKEQDGLTKNTPLDKTHARHGNKASFKNTISIDHDTMTRLSKYQMKHSKRINKKAQVEKILIQGNKKSKLQDLIVTHKTPENMAKIPAYMTNLKRNDRMCQHICSKNQNDENKKQQGTQR